MSKSFWYPTAFSVWDDAEEAAIDRVRASGQYTMGPEVAAFEAEFAAWHGRKYCVMCNSGSSANLLMIAALCALNRLKHGDIVAVPALAWSTTYAPLVQHGLQIRLLDCDKTWNANTIKQPSVTSGWNVRPKLVVGCSILGNPAHLDNLDKECAEIDAIFIEDNCESFGASMPNTRPAGTYGLMSSFSFFYSHQISAIEGGAVLTDDAELYNALRVLRSHGWTRDIVAPSMFDTEYNFVAFGYNLRPTEIHAAIAREQLRKAEQHRKFRYANMKAFRQMATEAELPIVHPDLAGYANPFGFAFTTYDNALRNCVATQLRENNIDCRLPTGGSFRCHAYGMGHQAQRTPFADYIHYNGMFLGNGPLDLTEQITKAVSVMKEALR
jgi:CDP-4-dehydro-6-deoxyglucose reductase, E1